MAEINPSEIDALKKSLKSCRPVLQAMGDEARLHLLLVMLDGACSGSRVIDLAQKAAMSRASVSHHLQILKQAGLVKSRKEGTLVFYYLDPAATKIRAMQQLFASIAALIPRAPDRTGDELRGGRVL